MMFRRALSPSAALETKVSQGVPNSTSGMQSTPCCWHVSWPKQAVCRRRGWVPLLKLQDWRWQCCLPHRRALFCRNANPRKPVRCFYLSSAAWPVLVDANSDCVSGCNLMMQDTMVYSTLSTSEAIDRSDCFDMI